MTTWAEWTPEAWARRLASGNPMFPFEWVAHYASGARVPRLAPGRVRTSHDVPLEGLTALRITGPLGSLTVAAPAGRILELVLRATIVGQLGDRRACGVARWLFGFRTAAGLWGIVVDPAGRPRPVTPHDAAMERRPDDNGVATRVRWAAQ